VRALAAMMAVLVGCARRAPAQELPPEAPPVAPAPTLSSVATPPAAAAWVPVLRLEPSTAEAKRVLDATFPKYLRGECPPDPAFARAGTWSELDRLQARAHAAGRFRPRVLQRIDGSFSRPGIVETLYAIELGECVGNGWSACIDVVFAQGAAKPALQVHYGGWGSVSCRYEGIAHNDGVDLLLRQQEKGEWLRLTAGDAWSWERAERPDGGTP
jgi:hypothetical protein